MTGLDEQAPPFFMNLIVDKSHITNNTFSETLCDMVVFVNISQYISYHELQ